MVSLFSRSLMLPKLTPKSFCSELKLVNVALKLFRSLSNDGNILNKLVNWVSLSYFFIVVVINKF